jgi:hypothetical protein
MITLAELDAIEVTVMKTADCRLLIIDPVGSFLGSNTDAHRDNEVRGVLAPLAQMADRLGIAVLIVMHTRKSGGAGGADERALGSRGFVGIARVVMHLLPDANDDGRRLLLSGKVNVGKKPSGLAFRIVGDEGSASPAWEQTPVTITADEAYAALDACSDAAPDGDDDIEETSALAEAVRWLALMLLKGPGIAGGRGRPKPGTIRAEAKSVGIAIRTLDRAKTFLGVLHSKMPEGWQWRLPRDGNNAWMLPDEVRQRLDVEASDEWLAHLAQLQNRPSFADESASSTSEVCQPRHDPGSEPEAA